MNRAKKNLRRKAARVQRRKARRPRLRGFSIFGFYFREDGRLGSRSPSGRPLDELREVRSHLNDRLRLARLDAELFGGAYLEDFARWRREARRFARWTMTMQRRLDAAQRPPKPSLRARPRAPRRTNVRAAKTSDTRDDGSGDGDEPPSEPSLSASSRDGGRRG